MSQILGLDNKGNTGNLGKAWGLVILITVAPLVLFKKKQNQRGHSDKARRKRTSRSMDLSEERVVMWKLMIRNETSVLPIATCITEENIYPIFTAVLQGTSYHIHIK